MVIPLFPTYLCSCAVTDVLAIHEFQPWLQKRFAVNTSASWAKIILLYSGNETHGFEMFFDLFSEFLQERHQSSEQMPTDSINSRVR